MIERLKRLQRCKELADDVKKVLEEESAPFVHDQSFIKELHSIYKGMCKPETSTTRRAFVFVVLYLYNPSVFVGLKRIGSGFRRNLAKVMQCHPTVISHDYNSAYFLYEHYRSFRDIANEIYTRFIDYIEKRK